MRNARPALTTDTFASMAAAAPPSARILGGETVLADDSPGRQPYPAYVQLRVLRRNVLGSDSSHFTCGGAIFHAWRARDAGEGRPRRLAGFWVATAAHCLDEAQEYQVAMWTGSGAASGQPVQLPPSVAVPGGGQVVFGPWRLVGPQGLMVFKHPLFDYNGRLHYDIAIIRVLLPPGEDLPASLLSSSNQVDWEARVPTLIPAPTPAPSAVVIGFGVTQLPDTLPSSMQRLEVAVEPREFRRRFNPTPEQEAMYRWVVGLPALSDSRVAITCNGDSGGPLFINRDGRSPILAGVLCCGFCKTVPQDQLHDYPAFYTRTDIFLGAASGEAETLLPTGSVWHRGILDIVARHSPTTYRTEAPSALAPITAASLDTDWAANDGEIVWVEGSGRRDLAPVFLRGALRIAVFAAAAVAAGALAVALVRAALGAAGAKRPKGENSARRRPPSPSARGPQHSP